MKSHNTFRYFKTSFEINSLAVMMHVRSLFLCNIEDQIHEHGIDIYHETVGIYGTDSSHCLLGNLEVKVSTYSGLFQLGMAS
jgi:transposase-like protein